MKIVINNQIKELITLKFLNFEMNSILKLLIIERDLSEL